MGMLARGDQLVYVQLFLFLQVLDLLTTLVGFKLGVSEASPFIRSLLHLGPVTAVAASKMVALVLGGVCIAMNRPYLVKWVNYWYAALVVWNLCTILAF